jgi:WhiB family redox-sensing transcriptional regulator
VSKAPGFDGTQPCASLPPDMFFPETPAETVRIKPTLKKICASCRFQEPCLQYALENAVTGVWAGTLERERRAMRRKLNITAKPVVVKI